MTTMTQSAAVKRIDALLDRPKAKVATHIPTNHLYRVVLEIPGEGVELEDTERRSRYVTWATWNDPNIWRKS